MKWIMILTTVLAFSISCSRNSEEGSDASGTGAGTGSTPVREVPGQGSER